MPCTGQKAAINAAIEAGRNAGGIYNIENEDNDNYTVEELQKVLLGKQFNLVDYELNGNRVKWFAFAANFTSAQLFAFPLDFDSPPIEDKIDYRFDPDGSFIEYNSSKTHYVRIDMEAVDFKSLSYGSCNQDLQHKIPWTETIKTKSSYGPGSSFYRSVYRTNTFLFYVNSDHCKANSSYDGCDCSRFTPGGSHLYDFSIGSDGPKYKNDYVGGYGANSIELFEKGFLDLFRQELDFILQAKYISKSKGLVFLLRVHAWLDAVYGPLVATERSASGKERYQQSEARIQTAILKYKQWYPKILSSEQPFTDEDDLRKYIKLLYTLQRHTGVREYFEFDDYIKYKEVQLEDLIKRKNEVEMKNNLETVEEKGLVFRHTFNFGKIGEDYVPPVTGYYNAGKVYKVGDTEIEEQDYREYIKEGDYNREIQGFTAVYQVINTSLNYYVVRVNISCTGTFSDVQKRGWLDKMFNWSYSNYRTEHAEQPIQQYVTYILPPGSNIKDQLIVGEKIPADFSAIIDQIVIIDESWLNGLREALTGSDLNVVNAYFVDERADQWQPKILENKNRLEEVQRQLFMKQYLPLIQANIVIKDEILFDKDFDSQVEVHIANTSDKYLGIEYQTVFDTLSIKLNPGEKYQKLYTIKGYDKHQLHIKIAKINEWRN